jgi:hypothetical protein
MAGSGVRHRSTAISRRRQCLAIVDLSPWSISGRRQSLATVNLWPSSGDR